MRNKVIPQRVFIRRIQHNEDVTSNNSDILKSSAERLGLDVVDTTSIEECLHQGTKEDLYIVTILDDVIKLRLRGRRNICCWYQGILPEESFMRNSSKFRFYALSVQERFSLNQCRINFFVSQAMLDHYNRKYKKQYNENSYILPCFNTEINESAFFFKEKYRNNYFVYAGGLQVWQCFNQTLSVYKRIEDLQYPDTKLIVMTKDQDLASEMIRAVGIKNYETGYTSPKDLPNVLSKVKFGFVLREDTPVNKVSTPTKISTYLSCGIIPIYSECINAFNSIASKMNYVIPWQDTDDSLSRVKRMMEKDIDGNVILSEYKMIFDTYYSNEYHINNIASMLKELL